MNYTGGKFKLLPQIIPLLPEDINIFVDLFGGGFNVGINVKANQTVYNDVAKEVSDMIAFFKNTELNRILEGIDGLIDEYELSKINEKGFYRLRDYYNNTMTNSIEGSIVLYTLICYAFNNQIRFNSKGKYNMPFGKNRSSFNKTLRKRFVEFVEVLQKINCTFVSKDFRDFNYKKLKEGDLVYCDPPYLITTASYNENGGWTEQEERDLLAKLDELNSCGIRFALSNVFESKGNTNNILIEWAKKYNVHYLNNTYSNCNYQRKDKSGKSVEVLITNYN